ncbi:MAG TPA: glycosyltransferase family 39 protein [Candidatus Acidoferrum sp.]
MTEETRSSSKSNSIWLSDTAMLVYIAAATVVIHWITGHRYGFQRDELATLDDSRHLDWGFVAYPPVTPFFGRLSLILFGTSLAGFRFFAAVAEAFAVVLTGLMAREMGGRRFAQLVAAGAAVPFCLAGGAMMQYVSFDYLCWVLAAYFVVKLLRTEDPRWWLAIGASVGFGFESKYTMGFFALGIAIAALLTDARRYFKSKWLWYGVALALLIFLPNLTWQVRNHFISLDFLRHIHARDVHIGRAKNFLPEQLILTVGGFFLFLRGMYFALISRDGKRFRMLGWMYLVPLTLFLAAKGRAYYLAAAYPMMYAAGAVYLEKTLSRLGSLARNLIHILVWIVLVADAALIGAFTLPITPANSAWAAHAMKFNEDFREEIGWPELVATIAQIRDLLPAEERAHLGILAGNYGEAGAVNLYGPQYGLPRVISGINSFWQQGYGDPPPQTLIVVGRDLDEIEDLFDSCRPAAHTWNYFGVMNEETRGHPNIFVCRTLRQPWPEYWKTARRFG